MTSENWRLFALFLRIYRKAFDCSGSTSPTTRLGPDEPKRQFPLYSAPQASALKIHPKVFNMIDCWISDSESPVVTEISLDAVERNANQFNGDGLKQDGNWLSYATPDSGGFMRYRVVDSKGKHYKIEYQENGGGTLTTSATIEFDIEQRNI
jgi:hypothetical protein